MKKFILGMTLAAMTAPASAATVYLECHLRGGSDTGGSPELLWNVTLNEEAGTVSWTIPTSEVADSTRAIFTADEVRWNSLTINRHDLTFTRSFNFGDGQPPMVTHGQCRLAPRRPRAF